MHRFFPLFILAGDGTKRGGEDTEVDTPVASVLQKMRVGREVVVLAMLEDEDALWLQQSTIYHQVGHGGQFWQRIGWIGKNQVKRLVTRLDKAEHIATDEDMVLGAYLFDTLLDEACMISVFLHTHDPLATTRK